MLEDTLEEPLLEDTLEEPLLEVLEDPLQEPLLEETHPRRLLLPRLIQPAPRRLQWVGLMQPAKHSQIGLLGLSANWTHDPEMNCDPNAAVYSAACC